MDFLFDFTILHVLISMIALVSGVRLTVAVTRGDDPYSTKLVFLVSTAANLLTGFLFPFHGVTPAIVISALNADILLGTIFASARKSSAFQAGRFDTVTAPSGREQSAQPSTSRTEKRICH